MRRFILRVFFLRELIFADRGQSAKFAKIRTRKIFMLHGSYLTLLCCSSAASRNSTATLPTTAPTTARHKKRQGGPLNRFFKQLKKQNKKSNSTCEELKECQRICVGQNEQLTNVSDCRTFKIHCTSIFRRSAKSKIQKSKNKKQKHRSD